MGRGSGKGIVQRTDGATGHGIRDATCLETGNGIVQEIGEATARRTRTRVQSAIAPRTGTAGEIARALKTVDTRTSPRSGGAHVHPSPIAPANRVLARPLHQPRRRLNVVDVHSPSLARAHHLRTNGPRSPFPLRKSPSVALTTLLNHHRNMAARRPTRRSPTSKPRAR